MITRVRDGALAADHREGLLGDIALLGAKGAVDVVVLIGLYLTTCPSSKAFETPARTTRGMTAARLLPEWLAGRSRPLHTVAVTMTRTRR
jgi:hypothetical protein